MHIEQLRKVTAIGGGHGLGRLMSSLSFLRRRLIGIVATTDNGGATGLLREAHQCIAWGDIRNCLSQLASQPLGSDILNYRFNDSSPLQGHNFGNLLLYTLNELSARPLDGIQLISRLLKVDARVLPMSESPTDLIAATAERFDCYGEISVDHMPRMPAQLRLQPEVSATPEALRHIMQSDIIIIGPGSFLTSVMPPLLIKDIARTISDSPAKVIFIDNLMAEQSPAGRISLSDRLNFIHTQLGFNPVDLVISSCDAHEVFPLPVIQGAIAEPGMPHRHQSDSLLHALQRAVTVLFDSAARQTAASAAEFHPHPK